MKKAFKIIIPLILSIAIILSIVWYLFIYDRNFTRDVLLHQARYSDMNGNVKLASWFYDLAYVYTGQEENIAIELANQYKADGNYTKAEVTLAEAITNSPTAELYAAMCKTFVEQDKLLDAVTLLDSITNPKIRSEIDALRPVAPAADPAPGFYNAYIPVTLHSDTAEVYYTLTGEYPSVKRDRFSEPFTLASGETEIYAIAVSPTGLVSSLTILNYTVGGVVEQATFTDPAMEAEMRRLIEARENDTIYTDDLWAITTFTVPAEAAALDDLALLPYLKTLTISDQKTESLAFLDLMPQLEELNLFNCRISDSELARIAALPSLTRLTLNNCGLSTIVNLENARNLTYLNLSNNTVRHLDVISGMQQLTEIDLQHNAVNSLAPLSGLSGLQKLNISYNSVYDLSPLVSCAQLNWLDAGHNALSNISSLSSLTGLNHLNLEFNNLSDISALAACTALTNLDISNNNINHVSALSPLVGLEYFDFSYNNVSALPNWPTNCALYSINGSHNNLDSLYALEKKENLAYIYMDYNRLTSIDILVNCYKLVMINVYGNKIHDVSALTKQNIIVNYDPTA